MTEPGRSAYGKYRGVVVSNTDPLLIGRLQVRVPTVLGAETDVWAMPCVPYAGPGVGLRLVPPTGANIWVEFEAGDVSRPIWSGCFWGAGEVPPALLPPGVQGLQVPGGLLSLSEIAGLPGFVLEVGPPLATQPVRIAADAEGLTITLAAASVQISAAGMLLSCTPADIRLGPGGIELRIGGASVALDPVSVDINNGALQVM
jgi:hypothetical protein